MLPNIKPEHINQDILKNRIESLEAWYVDSLIALIQWPLFIESCSKSLLEEWISPERTKGLQDAYDKNMMNMKGHEESIEQGNITITELKTYLTTNTK